MHRQLLYYPCHLAVGTHLSHAVALAGFHSKYFSYSVRHLQSHGKQQQKDKKQRRQSTKQAGHRFHSRYFSYSVRHLHCIAGSSNKESSSQATL
jgi:hypothetical protein